MLSALGSPRLRQIKLLRYRSAVEWLRGAGALRYSAALAVGVGEVVLDAAGGAVLAEALSEAVEVEDAVLDPVFL